MRSFIAIIGLLILSSDLFCQIIKENDISGEYILIQDSTVKLFISLTFDSFGLESFGQLERSLTHFEPTKEKDYVGDVIILGYDEIKGSTVISGDTITFFDQEHVLIIAILIDSLQMRIIKSDDPKFRNHQLFKIRNLCDCAINPNCISWVYTFYTLRGDDPGYYSDIIENISSPIKPMWSKYKCGKWNLIDQQYDFQQVHPLTKKYSNLIIY